MKQLMEDLRRGEFRHVYLLYGPEEYLKRQARDRLQKALLPSDDGMNCTVYDGDHLVESEVIDQAETLPFFAEHRVIRIDRSGLFKSSSEQLADYVKELPAYLYIIFTESEVDKRNRLFKAVQKYGRCCEFAEQTEETLAAWAAKQLGREGLRIRKADMDFLLSRTGTDMNRILLETDKLIHYCAGRDEVSREDIALVTSDTVEDRIFDMMRALAARKRREAMGLYADLLSLKEPPIRILALIGLEYNRLLMVRELMGQGLSDAQIAGKAGMPPFAVRRMRGLAGSYEAKALRDIIGQVVETDEAIKRGRMEGRLGVELLLVKLSA